MKITIDFETRSKADIKKCGASRYAEDPSTEAICLAICMGDSQYIWYNPKFISDEVKKHFDTSLKSSLWLEDIINSATEIEAHNAQFEYFIWKNCMTKLGFPMIDINKLRCSAAKAAMHNLPRSLGEACRVLGVVEQKDDEGYKIMLKMCKPRRATKKDMLSVADWTDWVERTLWNETPEQLIRLGEYCIQDTIAEHDLSLALSPLPPKEQELWLTDLIINDRGVQVDINLVNNALSAVEHEQGILKAEFERLTGIDSPTKRAKTLEVLNSLGANMTSLTANDVEDALSQTLPPKVKRILELRQLLSKSSIAKYTSFADVANFDDRLRGLFMYHGASTGRWTGKHVQPQNFPRGEYSESELDLAFNLLRDNNLDILFKDVTGVLSSMLRGMLVPKAGHQFICADFSSIEGRVLAWLADETSALEVYRNDRDPYKVAAASIYNKSYDDITKSERQIGKVAELALGYQGSIGAFTAMANGYGVKVDEDKVKSIVSKWRESRPMTVMYWRDLEQAAKNAILNKGMIYSVGQVKFKADNKFLTIELPSKRKLYYSSPSLTNKMMPWGETKKVIAFMGVNSTTRKWEKSYLYGGLLAENATQAVARDILANAIFNAESNGYPVVLHVHDEILAEVPISDTTKNYKDFEKLICEMPEWATGLPMKAEGWQGGRYKK